MGRSAIQAQVKKLVQRLDREQDRHLAYGAGKVRQLRTAQGILRADPELQVAFIKYAVGTVGRLGAVTSRNADDWMSKRGIPTVAFDLFRDLLRRDLPLTQQDFAVLFEQLAGVATLECEFIRFEPLVAHMEKRSAGEPLQPKLRRALRRVADALVGENLPPAAARLWIELAPRAAAKRLAARIRRLLAGPLECPSF